LKRISYFFVAFAVGKWTQDTCREMVFDLRTRVEIPFGEKRIQFFTDGNDDYTYIFPDYYKTENMDYGQLIKIRENGRVVRKEKRIIFGSLDLDDIETTDVENFNSILRERIGRLVRKSKCFTKVKHRLNCSLQLFLFYWNFMKEIHRKTTPAIMEGLSNRVWTWHDFFYFIISYP